jgi:hypothetical protein
VSRVYDAFEALLAETAAREATMIAATT